MTRAPPRPRWCTASSPTRRPPTSSRTWRRWRTSHGCKAVPDKFLHTDLEKILKDKGIQSVIVTGTASNGAVLFTAAQAALRGMTIIVPVDGMSAADPYAELTTAYTFASAPSVSTKSTLSRSDMIKF